MILHSDNGIKDETKKAAVAGNGREIKNSDIKENWNGILCHRRKSEHMTSTSGCEATTHTRSN